ncbi:MAG: dihydroorotate dehydrogenase [Desulfomonilia bacterium]|jgi:dihydroorotate dehydrogenase (NAD+) catalytic subunit|uniref:Dihydroorotate dehydrogenase B (NAD(+)), catalytic subunit n=1 Tax=anaerobic digester metagenome TaxID=1263854 RepID=A0A485M5S3_9ZZZZ|nr:dihydroorotate dehydrogenase [Pseudomonadota bacterium]HON38407.1 dihydroorotate dehydrogenase [Deltaproteobacteria bacterium]HPD21598.1 dihydroorotate dehydrogenase [Deltaproteobacteria bacterium]HRS56444.1 dihydroorotate dehydrogenase [Desulfomonilia bacterium]HRV36238.1 dihydroorotate dehydrogenase [Desulfomonilia bacterium]
MDISTRLAPGLCLKNPILSASGTFAYGEEFSRMFDLSLLGGVVTKGISLLPKEGNPTPRVCETPCGMLNAIGLENIGIDAFIAEKLPFLCTFDTEVIVNFFGTDEDEYVQMAQRLNIDGVSAIEMNVSCPNIKKGGIEFGKDPKILNRLVAQVRKSTTKPLIVKLSPMVTNIGEMALAAQEGGADALTCSNTYPAMAIDENTWKPILGNITGGLSGPAIKPIALRIVWEVSRQAAIPVIASGGATSWRDVVQFLLAGASAVEIGSFSLRDPLCFGAIIQGLIRYMQNNGLESITEIIGRLKTA